MHRSGNTHAHKHKHEQLCIHNKVPTTRACVCAEAKQSIISKPADFPSTAFLGHFLYALDQNVVKSLHWCVHKYIHNVDMDIALTLSHMKSDACNATIWSISINSYNSDLLVRPTPPQRFRRDPECSSKVPLRHASNCRQKANVSRIRMAQSGLGTYRVSLT